MKLWIRKIHTWLGLANMTVLLVFAVAGFEASLPGGDPRRGPARFVDYRAPANLGDLETARHMAATLNLPLTPRVMSFAIRRDEANHLAVELWTVNGIHYVTLLEHENRLRVESARAGLGRFLNHLHMTLPTSDFPDVRLHLWGWYIELSIWSLLAMAASGIYLWMASRLRHFWAAVFFSAGTAAFLIVYFGSRM